jgi:hypothetical protein
VQNIYLESIQFLTNRAAKMIQKEGNLRHHFRNKRH